MDLTEFNEIRPYNDEELPQIFEELIADPAFRKAATGAIPNVPFELLAQKMRTCKTKLDFQKAFCYGILWKIAEEHTNGLTLDHNALPNKKKAYTYNLLIYPWIKKLVRVNKSFIVQRALTMRQMLEASTRMSRYMHYTIAEKNQSIWIAQREGRAKDSNDRTQDSVLKMLAMGGEGDLIDRLKEMNIAPLAISYEYDPCDFLKAREFQLKRDIEGYKKTTQDDLINMQTGLFGYKGKVHFQVASCINDELEQIDRSLPKPELFAAISACIDQRIYRNYRMYPGNYVAYDWLNGTTEFTGIYSQEEKQQFVGYIEQQLGKIEIPNKDEAFLREKLLLMYANPLINHLAACR